jgi:hypothetical protein
VQHLRVLTVAVAFAHEGPASNRGRGIESSSLLTAATSSRTCERRSHNSRIVRASVSIVTRLGERGPTRRRRRAATG